MVTQLDRKSHLWTVFVLQWLCYTSRKSVTAMQKKVRLVFNRRKTASETVSAVVEIVVCLGRERFYESTGVFITISQWEDGLIVNHPHAALLNDQIQKKVTEFQKILIAMEVNHDDMTPAQFKTYLTTAGGNRRNFLAWMRERIQSRKLREGTRKGHITTFKALQRFGKFKTFDDVTLPHIHEFDLFLKEEKTETAKGKPICRSQAAIHNYHKRFKSYVNIISQITRPRTLICARTLISRSEKEMPSLDIKNPIPIFCGTHPAQWQRPHNAQPKPQKYMVFLIMPVKPTLELRS